ncbi:MAG TPA: adenylate cyclase [Cyanobacteria bacterium UBA11149]|nr:adenylate cyclase [Cyanobacteria bacterium UBA11367]HBE58699.1 adenylate cyclase [Cyanobacteria bacterium UBA11366]HBK62342.1 adenylate cyclase [Cyanobacteria bacterium UBA11166]HBR72288.1 adenylate cyclase [Cyanobacteria bacterium UBA11159]HBS71836.1 adenylate cyclase [Cyanobacteria bacterium UBA11153]HBW90328.1 adenylate cyclase [Cyanobacteria bacterium UBA11149]
MLHLPQFKSCFHVEILEGQVFLLSENNYFLLSGELYQEVSTLINGQNTVDDIASILEDKYSAAEVYYALMNMEIKGYIVERDDDIPSHVAAFWELRNLDIKTAKSRLKSRKVSVTSLGNVPVKDFRSTLASLNIAIEEAGDIEIVLTDDYLREELRAINQKSLELKRPWMLVKPVGKTIWLGPIFEPSQTGCWACLAQRLHTNRPVETYIQQQAGISKSFPTSLASLPSTGQVGLNLAATEIFKWIVEGKNKQLEGIIVSFDTALLKTENHILVRRHQCPVCGIEKERTQPSPIILESRKKTFTSDGGHRANSPEATLKKYEYHISKITGVVHSLQETEQKDNHVIHSYSAGHNFALMFDKLYFLRQTVRGKSGGKGKTDIQAKASALCEAIERYSGVFQGDEIRLEDSYLNLKDVAIHPYDCLNFSESQYKNYQEWNITAERFQQVPQPFDESKKIEWTPIFSLTNQNFKYLPTGYCYYGYPRDKNPYCWANSNGAAAGNTKEEAILQGFMELVERDSVALWWYNRIQLPGVNLDSFDDPYFQSIRDCYRQMNRELWVLDITADLNIPSFVAISRRIDREIEDIVFGFGSHFEPKIAILRAITEANQILPTVLNVGEDGNTRYPIGDKVAVEWWKTATVENQPYLLPNPSLKPKVYSDYPQLWSDDLRDDVMTCVEIAKEKGLEVFVLDQTRPDIGLNVVKVIVPGLRHFWRRLAPGRLYDIPVSLGWLSTPLSENELNPFYMFL